VIGKGLCPPCFKGLNFLPIYYYANKKAWITRKAFLIGFTNILYQQFVLIAEKQKWRTIARFCYSLTAVYPDDILNKN
jgi:hypothetical protein